MKKDFVKWQLLGLKSGSGLNQMLKLKIHSFISHIIKKVFLQIWHNNFFLDKLSCLGNSFRYFFKYVFFLCSTYFWQRQVCVTTAILLNHIQCVLLGFILWTVIFLKVI